MSWEDLHFSSSSSENGQSWLPRTHPYITGNRPLRGCVLSLLCVLVLAKRRIFSRVSIVWYNYHLICTLSTLPAVRNWVLRTGSAFTQLTGLLSDSICDLTLYSRNLSWNRERGGLDWKERRAFSWKTEGDLRGSPDGRESSLVLKLKKKKGNEQRYPIRAERGEARARKDGEGIRFVRIQCLQSLSLNLRSNPITR